VDVNDMNYPQRNRQPLFRLGRATAWAFILGIVSIVAAKSEPLKSPWKDMDATQHAVVDSMLPRMAIQHRGLDMTLAQYARYRIYDMTGKSSFPGEDPVFTYLGMIYYDEHEWMHAPLFPIDHPSLAKWTGHPMKSRLSPEDLSPGVQQRLRWIIQWHDAMSSPHARLLVGYDGGPAPTRDELAALFQRVSLVQSLVQDLENRGGKLDVETYRSWRDQYFSGAAKPVTWDQFANTDAWRPFLSGLEAIHMSVQIGRIPTSDLVSWLAWLNNSKGAPASDVQAFINDIATTQRPDTSLRDACVRLLMRARAFDERHDSFQLVPIPESLEGVWVDPKGAGLLKSSISGYAMELHNSLSEAYNEGKTQELAPVSARFFVNASEVEGYTSHLRRLASFWYAKNDPLLISALLYVAATIAFLIAQQTSRVQDLGAVKTTLDADRQPRMDGLWVWISISLLTAAFLVQTAAIACRVLIMERAPVSNIWESLVWVTWGAILFGLVMEMRFRTLFSGLIASVGGAAMLIGAASMPNEMEQMQPLRAVLVSGWLTYHVLAITLSYAAFMLSAAFAICYLLKEAATIEWGPLNWLRRIIVAPLPGLATLEVFSYRAIMIGYPLLTWGIFSGAVWADHAWGRFWAWDPKETWSLITWLIYTAFLHMRLRHGLAGRHLALVALAGFSCVLITWLGVSYMKIFAGLHSYANG